MQKASSFSRRPGVGKNAGAILCAALCVVAFRASPCVAQTVPARQDSTYLARMNAGYAAAKAGNQLAAATAFDSAALAAPRLADPLNAAGYAYLAAGRSALAISRFNAALVLEPDHDIIRRQVGYLYASAGEPRNAIAAFSTLREKHRASAQDFLALGNLNGLVGEPELAITSFRSALELATQTGDTAVLRSAQTAIRNLTARNLQARPNLWVELYVAPFYQDRFQNVLSLGFVRTGISAGGRWRPSAYLSLRATRDSKSVGGLQPVLYADNSVLPAVGVRVQPATWLTLYAEGGAAYPLVDVAERAWHRDLRAGLVGALSLRQPLTSNASGVALLTDIYGDASWYDRFGRDVIAYAQLRESLRVLQGNAGAVDVYARAWSAFDSKNMPSNRVVELGGGVALYGGAMHRVSLYAEALRGHYLNEPAGRTAGEKVSRNYDDFRITFVTGFFHLVPLGSR